LVFFSPWRPPPSPPSSEAVLQWCCEEQEEEKGDEEEEVQMRNTFFKRKVLRNTGIQSKPKAPGASVLESFSVIFCLHFGTVVGGGESFLPLCSTPLSASPCSSTTPVR